MEAPITRLRTIEVACLLASAADLGMGQPGGSSLRTALLSLGFCRRLGWDAPAQAEVLYLSMLHWAGCTSHGHDFLALFDDEIEVHRRAITMDFASLAPIGYIMRHAGTGRGAAGRLRTLTRAISLGPAFTSAVFTASCEVAEQIAAGLGLPVGVTGGLRAVFERWDGRGFPGEHRGDSIPATVRLVQVVHDWAVFERTTGVAPAAEALGARSGRSLDPALCRSWLDHAPEVSAEVDRSVVGRRALEVIVAEEPGAGGSGSWAAAGGSGGGDGGAPTLAGEDLRAGLAAVADFADVKTPFTLGQSGDVHRLVTAAGSVRDAGIAGQAAWLPALGRVAIPIGVWERAGPLSGDEWDTVRQYPAHTERLLSAGPTLRALAPTAGAVQERGDGSGYYRRVTVDAMPPGAALLQAASMVAALRRPRPYRPAYSQSAIESILATEVGAGRLDRTAVDAVLGSSSRPTSPASPAGLTDREIDVLRLALTGLTNRQIGRRLYLTPHTVDTHLRHVYRKLGVSTRAAASVRAIRLGINPWDHENA